MVLLYISYSYIYIYLVCRFLEPSPFPPQRNPRGPNRNIQLDLWISKNKRKFPVYISSKMNRAVGEHSEWLTREIGILVRQHAPVKNAGWAHIPHETKDEIFSFLLVLRLSINSFIICV